MTIRQIYTSKSFASLFISIFLDLENTRIAKYKNKKKEELSNGNKTWFNEYYQQKENVPINLIDCIEYYYHKTNEFVFLCPYCNKACKQCSKNRIYASPNIFIFILNRGKNNIFQVKMDYPPQLDMSKYVETTNKSPTKYELTGVITHLGVSGPNGHFIAFCTV